MIKLIRKICIVLFALSAIVFCGVMVYSSFTSDSGDPIISMDDDEVTVSVANEDSAILEGVTAKDDEDGDVTDSLVIESMSNFITVGVREATIAAFDSSGNVTKTTRSVIYSDYTSPAVTLSGALTASTSNSSGLLDVIRVTDCLDGDLTDQVQVVFDDNSQSVSAGEYAMHIQVSNSAGDTLDLPVTVRFYNTTDEASAPKISLTDYLIYVKQGAKVDAEDYLDTITFGDGTYRWSAGQNAFVLEEEETDEDEDEEESGYVYGETGEETDEETEVIDGDSVKIDNPVDTSSPGTYEIVYSYSNSDSGQTATVRLIVIVEEG